MSTTKILTIVFGVVSVGLAYYLFWTINSSIAETERIERLEARIIEQLKMIREAEVAYESVYGQYTSDWDKLLNFVDTGRFYLVSRRDSIIVLDYNREEVIPIIDTLGTVNVKDSIFKKETWPRFNLSTLPYVPNVEPPVKFEVWADKIEKAGKLINVIEVVNPSPVNPDRDPESELRSKLPLRFGSRTSITTGGNWE